MSIVDDRRMHVVAEQARRERLWQTTDPTLAAASPFRGPSTAEVDEGRARHPSYSRHPSHPSQTSHPSQDRAPDVFTRAGANVGDQMWQARIDLVVSSGLSGEAARMKNNEAQRDRDEASFDALRTLCQDELRPVLECSVEMLAEWGMTARVTETLRDQPARVP